MKSRFLPHCLLAWTLTGAVSNLPGQVPGQGMPPRRPVLDEAPQIRVQSPLLETATEGEKTVAKDKEAPPVPTTAKTAAETPPAATEASAPVLLPGADAAQPMALTPDGPPPDPLPPEAMGEDAPVALDPNLVFIPKLKGIHLFKDVRTTVDGQETKAPPGNPVGITFDEGLTTPDAEALTEALRKEYLGKGLSFNRLDKIVKDILLHYSNAQRPTTHVYIPQQEITDIVKIAVLEGRLGEVGFAGEGEEGEGKRKWFQSSSPRVPRALEAQRGEVLNMDSIERSVTELNVSPWARLGRLDAHPYRSATVALAPGAELGLTNATIDMKSRVAVPVQAFTGWDNSGTVVLGENRFNLGAVWYDAFNTGLNHQLGFQAQSAEDYDLFHATIASYQIPVPSLKSTIQLYGAFMQSSVDIPAAGVAQSVEGDAWILGGRWFYRLPDWYVTQAARDNPDKSRELALYHEIGIGFDYKNQENNLFFGGVNVFPTQIEVAQYVAEYNLRQTDKWGETTLGLSYFYSPGSITRNNTDADFLTARSEGTADYSYFRGTFSRLVELGDLTGIHQLQDFKFLVRGTGQWSNANLVASEQLGLGGYDSVRGYPERTMRGDKGLFIQAELYSRAFHPLAWLAKKSPNWLDRWTGEDERTDELRLLVFYDYGWADVTKATPAEPGDILNASSVGVGIRYRFNKTMTFRFDYGYQLEKLDPRRVNSFDLSPKYSNQGDGYAHIGLSLSF